MNAKIKNTIFFLSMFGVQSFFVRATIEERIGSANLEPAAASRPNPFENRAIAAAQDAQSGARAASLDGNKSSQSHIIDPSSSAKFSGVSISDSEGKALPESKNGKDAKQQVVSVYPDSIARGVQEAEAKRGNTLLAGDKAGISSWEKVSLAVKKNSCASAIECN